MTIFGIRREDKNKWEARVPLVPQHISELIHKYGFKFVVQPSSIRCYKDEEYEKAGAVISEDLQNCSIILAVKEIPPDLLLNDKVYVFFSHTIKGQKYNMPMLRRLIELKCTLIDYERILDENGKRLIFFGRFAGLAGMIDTLWAYNLRHSHLGIKTPFTGISQAYQYESLNFAKKFFANVADRISSEGISEELSPLVIGFMGYGNVSKGAQEIIDLLPVETVSPEDLETVMKSYKSKKTFKVFKVVFKEKDMVKPLSSDMEFDLLHYYKNPRQYVADFEKYLPYISILMNCIYWTDDYPKFVTKEYVKALYNSDKAPHLKIIGDISCDIEGAIECTVCATSPEKPVFVYDALNDKADYDLKKPGLLIMAVDNLPCEFPKESSYEFSSVLKNFIQPLSEADFTEEFKNCNLPPELKKATILHKGNFTEDYVYMKKFLE